MKNEVYWWGIIPFEQRKRQLDSLAKCSSKRQEEMVVGSVVCMKKQPVYRAGTRAVKLIGNEPRIGELTQDAVKYDQTAYEFKILTLEQLYESELSGVDANQSESGLDATQKGKKRKFGDTEDLETEKWPLNEVVFLPEVAVSTEQLTGKIVKMEGSICAVSFGGAENIRDSNLKLLSKDDICLANNIAKGPDPVQKKPVKINIGANLRVVAAQIDEESIIHLLMRHSGLNKIQYGKFDIGKGEMISGITSLPTTPSSFELPEQGMDQLFLRKKLKNNKAKKGFLDFFRFFFS